MISKPVLKTQVNVVVEADEEFNEAEVITGVITAVTKVRNGFYGYNVGILVNGTWFNFPVPTKETPVPTKGDTVVITNEPPFRFPSFQLFKH